MLRSKTSDLFTLALYICIYIHVLAGRSMLSCIKRMALTLEGAVVVREKNKTNVKCEAQFQSYMHTSLL